MYTPHTITLVIVEDGSYNAVVLPNVFLDLSKQSSVNMRGLADADSATLYIPFSVKANKTYVVHKEYSALQDKSGYWTLFDDGEDSGADCYFIKGEHSTDIYPFSTAKLTYDYVYRVASVDLRDFGSLAMRHWQVGAR